jgi:hypothetical protein
MEEFAIKIQKPMYVNKITCLFHIVISLYPAQFEYKGLANLCNKKTRRAAETCLQKVTEEFAIVQQKHEQNLEAIEHNKKNADL